MRSVKVHPPSRSKRPRKNGWRGLRRLVLQQLLHVRRLQRGEPRQDCRVTGARGRLRLDERDWIEEEDRGRGLDGGE